MLRIKPMKRFRKLAVVVSLFAIVKLAGAFGQSGAARKPEIGIASGQ